ncbi:glycoside hydrolase family 2 TIM barrel-domain containing protein, partial [Clostridium perfringens]
NFTNTDIFYQRTLRDTREMIRRDRNRPSVILWETSLNETPYSEQWAKDATKAAHEEYPGDQLSTAADYGYHGSFYDVGYKVQDTQWSDDPADWVDYDPNKPFFTREWGDFEGASKALRKDGEAAMNTQVLTRQRYLNGNGYSDWGGLDASDRIGGYFLWSWNDYTRGSTTETLGSGTVDIDRYEKNGFYWLQSIHPYDNPVNGSMIYISSDYTENSSLKIPVY